jgi:hypothetical protein
MPDQVTDEGCGTCSYQLQGDGDSDTWRCSQQREYHERCRHYKRGRPLPYRPYQSPHAMQIDVRIPNEFVEQLITKFDADEVAAACKRGQRPDPWRPVTCEDPTCVAEQLRYAVVSAIAFRVLDMIGGSPWKMLNRFAQANGYGRHDAG